MSDTAKAPDLASARDFDARLKQADEDRWLASRFASDGARRALVAMGLLGGELRRALGMSEPMLGRIRVQWWRETLEAILAGGPVRRHDLSEELARTLAGRHDVAAAIEASLAAFDEVLDRTGAADALDHGAQHALTESALARLGGVALLAPGSDVGVLEDVAECGRGYGAVLGGSGDTATAWTQARRAFERLDAGMRPAALHACLAHPPGTPALSALGRRWRLFRSMASGQLPTLGDAGE